MKRVQLFAITLCMAITSVFAQRSYNFNAVALNVDGLPNKILTFEINPDGKEAAGATALCNAIANSGWSFCGFSEDFNFHSELTAAPASNYYNFGAHGGKVSSTSNSTDGLGFACLKQLSMSGGTKVAWNSEYGGSGLLNIGDNGADNMINKGFRVYTVTFADGVAVDVYVLHMDAGTADSDDDYDSDGRDKNIVARESQLTQLANYIKSNHNKRPVIILGDTNCRYTREQLKTGFIDVLNADNRFSIKDVWVEKIWGGTYPTYGSSSIMTSEYGAQKGEVVDKIFYINTTESKLKLEANSYLHDTSVAVSDHYPVVAHFTLTDPNGKAPSEDDFTVDVEGGAEKPVDVGCQVTNGATYFIKNVATGSYLKSGADYGTRAIVGSAGMAVTFKSSGSNWQLYTTSSVGVLAQYEPYMDGTPGVWTLEKVPGTTYQYYIKCSAGTLSTSDNSLGKVYCVNHNADDNKQKWVLLTEEQMKAEMSKGSSLYPYDATPLLRAADFDRMDAEFVNSYTYWTGADASTIGGIWWEGDAKYNGCAAIVNTKSSTSISQTISNMPAGYYRISFEGFYRSIRNSSDQTVAATVTIGGKTMNLAQNKSTTISTDRYVPGGVFRDNDTYAQNTTFQLTSSADITVKITNPSTTGNNWVCVDNFKLSYSVTGFSNSYEEYRRIVGNKINETYEKVLLLNKYGQAAYDVSIVIYRYKNNLITSQSDAEALCEIIDNAYANAYAAHLAAVVKDALDNMTANGGDITSAIINPSFEMGDLTGWITAGATDLGVYPNSNGTYAAAGCDGTYLFNAWSGDDGHTSYVKQTITGLPNGLYELKASLASFGVADGKSHDYKMYLFGNGYNTSVEAVGGKTSFQEATLYFLVEDGTATIGAVGGNKGGGNTFIYYMPTAGCFLKADNFRLKYICDAPHGRLKLALDEAENTQLDVYGKAALNITDYQAMFENKMLVTDGVDEADAVYVALQTAVKAQCTVGADMTWAIVNPSFETGDYRGWTTVEAWDTKVASQETSYSAAGAKGRFLFNTWNNAVGATNQGVNMPIVQTVTGLPNGQYLLTAMMASDSGNTLCLKANDKEGVASGKGPTIGVFPMVECEVVDGTLTIEAGGGKDCWYKCDDFRLTLIAPKQDPVEADGLKVHFTFEDANSRVGEFTGKLYNNASFATWGGLPVLSLGGSDGYFDMGSSVGDVIATLEDFTISTNVYIPTTTHLSNAGNFLYTFANSTKMAADANGCIFFRANDAGDTRYAISMRHWEGEQSLSVSQSPFTDGEWHTITYRQANGKGEIYVDGNLAVSGNISLEPKDLGATPYNFLGRSCYVGDAYLKDAMYHDFRVYKGAVDDATLSNLTDDLEELNKPVYRMQIKELMQMISIDSVLYHDVELPAPFENGITITWSSSDESLVKATGEVNRPAYLHSDAKATLTATFTKKGVTETKSFDVILPAWELDDEASVQADFESINLKGCLENLMSNLYLPTKGLQGSTITWSSDSPDYLDANGELLKQDPDVQKKVVLTATVTKGAATATREFTIKLAYKLPVKYYLFAYFNGNEQWQEQICFALSKDGYNYTPLNEGNPIINSSDIAKKKAVRDPHILRGADGYFYMVVTDMKSSEGWSSNDGLVLLRSKDMINWTHSAIDFPTRWPHRFDRESLTQVWAPQTIYDPKEDKYMVYYAIGENGKNYITYYSYANEDFTDLTEPQVLYNHWGNNTIDADIVYYNGLYHMFFKTEGQGNGIQKATAKTLQSMWRPEYRYLQQTTAAVEGSGVFRLIDSDTWVLMYDCYTSGMYQYCTSTDLANFTYKCNSANTSIFTPRHGTTITITSEEACRLLNKWPTASMFDIPLELYDTSEDDLSGIDGEYSSVTIHRPIKVMTNDGESRAWSSMVLPVDLKAEWLGDYEVKTLKSSNYDEATGELSLQFATVESMQAGVPYMVRYIADNTDQFENNKVPAISLPWKTTVDTQMRDTITEHITFKGVYARDYVPAGAFFISDNVFYQAATPETNRLKAFRAYLELNSNVASKVRSISYRMAEDDDDDTPGDDEGNGDDNSNVDDSVDSSTAVITSIAIYNTAGERLETMQVGLNILLMSDGSIIKVMVKE